MRVNELVLLGLLLGGCGRDRQEPAAPGAAGDPAAGGPAPLADGAGLWAGIGSLQPDEMDGPVTDEDEPDPEDEEDDEDPPAPVDVQLRSRADLGALCALTDEVTGDLTLTCEDCVDLAELSCLRVIGGALTIESNPLLETLHGLEGVERLGSFRGSSARELALRDNPVLRDVSGLGAPAAMGLIADIDISRNPALVHLDWQVEATDVDFVDDWYPLAELRIQDNDVLVDVEGIGYPGRFWMDALVIDGNPALERLPVDTVLAPEYSVHIVGNDSLVTLPPLDAPYLMDGVRISQNASLQDLDQLEMLGEVEVAVYIEDNDALVDAGGLAGVHVIGGFGGPGLLVISGNDALEVLDVGTGFEGCQTWSTHADLREGWLRIEDNASLRSIQGFDGVGMNTSLAVIGNPALESLGGFASLDRPHHLEVTENPTLPTSQAMAFDARVDPVSSTISGNGGG